MDGVKWVKSAEKGIGKRKGGREKWKGRTTGKDSSKKRENEGGIDYIPFEKEWNKEGRGIGKDGNKKEIKYSRRGEEREGREFRIKKWIKMMERVEETTMEPCTIMNSHKINTCWYIRQEFKKYKDQEWLII